jgi:hypothetical protein
MGLKGYRLWVMGQVDSTCSAPPCMNWYPSGWFHSPMRSGRKLTQMKESKRLKPGYHTLRRLMLRRLKG